MRFLLQVFRTDDILHILPVNLAFKPRYNIQVRKCPAGEAVLFNLLQFFQQFFEIRVLIVVGSDETISEES